MENNVSLKFKTGSNLFAFVQYDCDLKEVTLRLDFSESKLVLAKEFTCLIDLEAIKFLFAKLMEKLKDYYCIPANIYDSDLINQRRSLVAEAVKQIIYKLDLFKLNIFRELKFNFSLQKKISKNEIHNISNSFLKNPYLHYTASDYYLERYGYQFTIVNFWVKCGANSLFYNDCKSKVKI